MMTNISTMRRARRHNYIALLGRRERVYFTYQRWLGKSERQPLLVGSVTDLCVEAPPGSGNTFFVNGFSAANPSVRLAHHHHVAAQVRRAARLSIPTLLIVRDPVACVLSRAVSFQSPEAIGPTFREWISFWRGALPVTDHAVVADFPAVTDVPQAVIKQLNVRYNRDWSTAFPSTAEVFASMDEARAAAFPSFANRTGFNPNRPDPRKDQLRAWLGPQVRDHPLASAALSLYDRVASAINLAV